MVICDLVQLREETTIGRILGAVEDALEDGLVLRIDVVVLQDTEDVGNNQSPSTTILDTMVRTDTVGAHEQYRTS